MELNKLYTREQAMSLLQELHEKGYRYVVRDKELSYLNCFSLKPKKYMDIESWGYVNPDAPGVMMSYPIKNADITEINWTNRSATLIEEFIAKS